MKVVEIVGNWLPFRILLQNPEWLICLTTKVITKVIDYEEELKPLWFGVERARESWKLVQLYYS